eukprot:EG_transcript_44947
MLLGVRHPHCTLCICQNKQNENTHLNGNHTTIKKAFSLIASLQANENFAQQRLGFFSSRNKNQKMLQPAMERSSQAFIANSRRYSCKGFLSIPQRRSGCRSAW